MATTAAPAPPAGPPRPGGKGGLGKPVGRSGLPLWVWLAAGALGLVLGLVLLRGKSTEEEAGEAEAGGGEVAKRGGGGGGGIPKELLSALGLEPPASDGGVDYTYSGSYEGGSGDGSGGDASGDTFGDAPTASLFQGGTRISTWGLPSGGDYGGYVPGSGTITSYQPTGTQTVSGGDYVKPAEYETLTGTPTIKTSPTSTPVAF